MSAFNHRAFMVVVIGVALGIGGTRSVLGQDQYAAIAYSPAAKKHGYSYSQPNLAAARSVALVGTGMADAQVVVWSANNWCALAVEKDGQSFAGAYGPNELTAASNALRLCRQQAANPDKCFVAITVFSGWPQPALSIAPPVAVPLFGPAAPTRFVPNPTFNPIFGRTYGNAPGHYSNNPRSTHNPVFGRTYANRP